MRKRFSTLLLLLGVLLQTLLPVPLFLKPATWPVLLSLVLYISLKSKWEGVLYAGLLAGALHDVFCPAPLGLSIPFFLLISIGVYAVHEEVFGDHIVTYLVLGLMGGGLKAVYFGVAFAATGLRPLSGGLMLFHFLSGAFLGSLTASVVFLSFSMEHRRRFRRRRLAW